MKYISFVMVLVSLLLLSGCQEQQVVKYLEFDGVRYEEISPNTYLFDGNYIYTVEIGMSVEITFSFIEATMVVQSHGNYNVTYDQGTEISCTQTTCITNRFETVPYEGEDFRSLAEGVQTNTGSSVSALSPGIVLLTIIFSFASLFCIIIATSFDRTKGMLEILYKMNWRFRGEIEPSDAYVFYTMFSLWLIPIFTVFWFILFII